MMRVGLEDALNQLQALPQGLILYIELSILGVLVV